MVFLTGPSKPKPLMLMSASVTFSSSTVIQWSVSEVAFTPESYTVYYALNSNCPDLDEGFNKSDIVYGFNQTGFLTTKNQQYNVTLHNLIPHTVYCYKVVARNTVGRINSNIKTCE